FRSTTARRAIERCPSPRTHKRSTSCISCTRTSLKLIATCLGRLSVRWRLQPQRRRRWWMLRGGPITGGGMVPCCWRNSPQGGPMLLAGDTSWLLLVWLFLGPETTYRSTPWQSGAMWLVDHFLGLAIPRWPHQLQVHL